MSAFDLFPAEAAAKLERRPTVDLNAGAGFFEGSLAAPVQGAVKGMAVEPARVLNLAVSNIPGAIDAAFGTSTRDWWFDNMMLERVSRKVTPNPRETGMAGQMLHSLFDVGGQALTVGPAGVGVLKTVGKSIEGVEEGLDTLTAMKKGALEGAAAGIGVALPIAIPPVVGSKIPALVQQLGYGVASNVPMGIASRALTHDVLAKAGYADMAEQYKALDETGLMTDAVLGLAFGALGHVLTAKGQKLPEIQPADVDAALAKRNAYHLEVDTAPGLARNGETRDAHVESVLKATEDLIEGRPVDVGETLRAADFEPNPGVDKARDSIARESAKVAEPIAANIEEERAASLKAVSDLLLRGIEPKKPESPVSPERMAQVETALKAEGIESTPETVAQVELLTLARSIDAVAVDAIPLTLSDGAYLAKVKEVVDGNEKTPAAGEARQGPAGARPGAEAGGPGRDQGPGAKAAGRESGKAAAGGEGSRHVDDAEIRGAEELVATKPDMLVTLEDGTTVPAHAALAKADEVIAQAELEAQGFEAAVLCATRRGG